MFQYNNKIIFDYQTVAMVPSIWCMNCYENLAVICIVHCRFSTFQCFFDTLWYQSHRRVIFAPFFSLFVFQCHVPSMLSEHNINGAIFGRFTKSLSYVLNDFWVLCTGVATGVHVHTGAGTDVHMYVCSTTGKHFPPTPSSHLILCMPKSMYILIYM